MPEQVHSTIISLWRTHHPADCCVALAALSRRPNAPSSPLMPSAKTEKQQSAYRGTPIIRLIVVCVRSIVPPPIAAADAVRGKTRHNNQPKQSISWETNSAMAEQAKKESTFRGAPIRRLVVVCLRLAASSSLLMPSVGK